MVQQLKDQMTPCFSASMVKKLFHDDFKYHIEAISLLSEVLIFICCLPPFDLEARFVVLLLQFILCFTSLVSMPYLCN